MQHLFGRIAFGIFEKGVILMLENIIGTVNDYLYGYVLIVILLLGGIFFTFRTRFVQIRLFGEQIRSVTEKPSDSKGVSSF